MKLFSVLLCSFLYVVLLAQFAIASSNTLIYTGNWTVDPGIRVFTGVGIGAPSAIQLSNGSIALYYSAYGSTSKYGGIVYALSNNGLNFTPALGNIFAIFSRIIPAMENLSVVIQPYSDLPMVHIEFT